MPEVIDIDNLFPKYVRSYCCRIQDYTQQLHPEEFCVISKAIEKRRYEFSSGRLCVKKALQKVEIDSCILKQGINGEPLWPDNVTGTISHSNSWAGAAVAIKNIVIGIGFDIETVGRINDRMLKKIITDQEKNQLKRKNKQESGEYTALIFSAKEAFYKALSYKYTEALRFKDISIISNDDSPEFGILFSNKLKTFLKNHPAPFCRYFIHENNIFTAITFPKI